MLPIISTATANSFNHFSNVFTLSTNADLGDPEGKECPDLPDPSDLPDLEDQADSSDEEDEDEEPSSTRNPPTATQAGNERTPPTSPVPTAAPDNNHRSTLPSSPLKRLSKQLRGWVYATEEEGHKTEVIETSTLTSHFRTYLKKLTNLPWCIDVYGGRTKCSCLNELSDQDDSAFNALIKALLSYRELSPHARSMYELTRLQYAQALKSPRWQNKNGPERVYVLPVEVPTDIDISIVTDDLRYAFQHRICSSAWCNIHNLGRRRFGQLKTTIKKMDIKKHGNSGKNNRQKPLLSTLASVRAKLTQAKIKLACPFATKIVTDMAGGVSFRGASSDDEDEIVYLPPNATKRALWLEWVRERGWDPVQTCKNRRKYKRKNEWDFAPGFYCDYDDANLAEPLILPDGTEVPPAVAKPVVPFSTFHALWKREFSYLRVRARGEDTCTICFKIRNNMRHLVNKKTKVERQLNSHSDVVEEGDADGELPEETAFKISEQLVEMFEGDCPETEAEVDTGEELFDGTTPEELEGLIKEIESEVRAAKEHVKMHMAQREESQVYMAKAIQDLVAKVPLGLMTMVLTMDMSQNGTVPSLGADQCGDFYYMSPLIEYIFGICNNATHFMDCYIWGEGTAARGADNIVSCLNTYLTKYGVVNGTKLKELVIIADNCAGQNKNNCVIQYLCWLVEAGWCGSVVLFFLVKGHTKNECDSKFNCLKIGTRGVNIFTEAGLDAAYRKGNQKTISLTRIAAGDNVWRGYTSGLANLYRKMESGQLMKNHIFTFGGDNRFQTTISRQLYRDADKIEYDLRRPMTVKTALFTEAQRAAAVRDLNSNLLILPPPGLSAIKENDLHAKVGKLAPEHCKGQYPKPSAKAKATDQTRKKAKSEKAKEKKKNKLEQIESHNIHNIVARVLRDLISSVENGDSEYCASKDPPVLTSAAASLTKRIKQKPGDGKDPRAPKRARTAYGFFCTKTRAQMKRDGDKRAQNAASMGAIWKTVSLEERKEFQGMAKDDKQRHETQMELYKIKGVNKQKSSPLHAPTPTEEDETATHYTVGYC